MTLFQIQSPDARGVKGDQQAKARNFFKLATSLSVVKYACFLHDVLYHLSQLSSTLQSNKVCVVDVHNSLQSTNAALETLKQR